MSKTLKTDGRGRHGKQLRKRIPPRKRTIPLPPQAKTDEARRERQDIFIAAYTEVMCNVTLACKNCGIAQSTVYHWRETDPDFVRRMDAKKRVRIDFYENALDKAAQGGSVAAIAFFLKCQAKDRGYVERAELTGPGGGPVQLAVSREEMSDAALASALRRMVTDDQDFAKQVAEGVTQD